MNYHRILGASLVLLFIGTLSFSAWPATDQLEDIYQKQNRERQHKELRELRGRQQIDNLKRDQQAQQFQREIEQRKRAAGNDPKARDKLNERQRRLDDLRIDRQLEQAQRDLQFDSMQGEQNSLRKEEQIRELQRQQQMDLLRDQSRKTQQDLDRLR